ncbi:DUF5519 family protein [Vibrio sp. SNU_ST1]|uniref:luciferase domain-containing protein n=1 Tax=Vibrio sp. SNU_ST1 TaxID=3064001 RepID=UPI00272DB203|nr:luciferase family protein [Vibrio sp. SNU_ST1]WKY57274.1 DUF5519 family protein [Vibrio sp. SNU_ST1]
MNQPYILPIRSGKKPVTGDMPPHLQFSEQSPEVIWKELCDWAFSVFPLSREEATMISIPASRALWLDESVKTLPHDAFMPPKGSREFAHVHKDGSMHLCVSQGFAEEVYAKKWGEPHPYKHLGVNEILVYAPRNAEELEVVKMTLKAAYYYATGDVL